MELKNFFVDPAFRGRNIGRGLLTTVIKAIEAFGAKETVLHTTVYMVNAIFALQRLSALFVAQHSATFPTKSPIPKSLCVGRQRAR